MHSLDGYKNIKTGMYDPVEYVDHSLEQENETDQSITLGYLPSWAIRLSLFSRLRTNLQGWPQFSLTKDSTGTVRWSESPKGGKCYGSSKTSLRLVKTRSKIASCLHRKQLSAGLCNK